MLLNTGKTNSLQEFGKTQMETEFIFKFSGRKQMKIKLTHSGHIGLYDPLIVIIDIESNKQIHSGFCNI